MEYNLPITVLIDRLETDYFNDKWLQISNEATADTHKDLWVNNIVNASTEIFRYYILWFLSGEYCLLANNKRGQFDIGLLETALQKISNQIEVPDEESIQHELQNAFARNILYPLKHHVKRTLIYFERDLRSQVSLEHKKQLLRGDKIDENGQEIDEQVLAYSSTFRHVIYFTRIEHFTYHYSETIVRDLLLLGKEVGVLQIDDELKEAIGVKLNFLLRKLLYRIRSSNSDSDAGLVYSFDQEDDVELSVEKIPLSEKLDEWDKLINTHYGFIANFKFEQRKRVQAIYEKGELFYCYQDFHGLIKIFKDDTKSIEQTINLIDLFSQKESSSLQMDEYARKVTQSYLFNNKISLECENNRLTYDQCNDLYEMIRNHQNINNVRNYFPWEKLAQTISRKIDELLDNLIDKNKYNQFKVFLRLYAKTIDKLEETSKWSKSKSFLPIQMPFSECQSNYDVIVKSYPTTKLFFFSSFLLPLNYSDVSKSKEELRLRKLKYDTLDSVYDKLQHVVEDVNESSEKMRKQERRSVEILAIFSAVALFSVGSIQIFSQEAVTSDPHVYYRFIMAFGYSLCLFVLLIWIITRDNIKQVHIFHWIIVILVFISSCFAIGYFVGD